MNVFVRSIAIQKHAKQLVIWQCMADKFFCPFPRSLWLTDRLLFLDGCCSTHLAHCSEFVTSAQRMSKETILATLLCPDSHLTSDYSVVHTSTVLNQYFTILSYVTAWRRAVVSLSTELSCLVNAAPIRADDCPCRWMWASFLSQIISITNLGDLREIILRHGLYSLFCKNVHALPVSIAGNRFWHHWLQRLCTC